MNGETKKNLLNYIMPLLSGLLAAGITYGALSEKVKTLTDVSNDNVLLVRQIDRRLSYIEGALNIKERPFKKLPFGIQNENK